MENNGNQITKGHLLCCQSLDQRCLTAVFKETFEYFSISYVVITCIYLLGFCLFYVLSVTFWWSRPELLVAT